MRIYFEQKTIELNVHIFLIKLFTQKVHVYLTGSIYTKCVYVLNRKYLYKMFICIAHFVSCHFSIHVYKCTRIIIACLNAE